MAKPTDAAALRAVRAVAGACIAAARAELAAAPSDAAVHAVRSDLKRARAFLRMLRDGLGPNAARHTDRVLQGISQQLGAARDAAQLAAQLRATAAAAGLSPAAVRTLRKQLATERHAALRPVQPGRVAAQLDRVARGVARLPLRGDEATLAAGFTRIYRQARKAYLAARQMPTADALHVWRRHTKRYWHALELLRPAWPRVVEALSREAHALADLLGTHHNLALLESRVVAAPLGPAVRRPLAAALARERRDAATAAFALGALLFEESPRRQSVRAGRYWERWGQTLSPPACNAPAPAVRAPRKAVSGGR